MSEDRSVHTDALHTLGSIIGESEKRDAIHLAVEPVVAGERLTPGQNVGRMKDGTFGATGVRKRLGVVDPFLPGPIKKGDRFWLIVYPRQITALHHVWEHPDFPNADGSLTSEERMARVRLMTEKLTNSGETWIKNEFVPKVEDYGHALNYEDLLEGAKEYLETGNYVCLPNDIAYEFVSENIAKFWENFTKVTGQTVPEEKRQPFFNCAC